MAEVPCSVMVEEECILSGIACLQVVCSAEVTILAAGTSESSNWDWSMHVFFSVDMK